MIFMFITLVLGSMLLEFKLAYHLHITHFTQKYALLNIGMSLGLSIMLAAIFPAAGLIVLSAGLVSTALSMQMYDGYYAYKNRVRPKIDQKKAEYQQNKQAIHQYGHDILTVFKAVIWIVVLPVRILRQLGRGIQKTQEVYSEFTQRTA